MVRLFRPIPAHVQLLLSSKILSHRLERYEGAVFSPLLVSRSSLYRLLDAKFGHLGEGLSLDKTGIRSYVLLSRRLQVRRACALQSDDLTTPSWPRSLQNLFFI